MVARALFQRTVQAWKALPGDDKYFVKGAVCAVPISIGVGSMLLAESPRDLFFATMFGTFAGVGTVVAWPAVMPVAGLACTLALINPGSSFF